MTDQLEPPPEVSTAGDASQDTANATETILEEGTYTKTKLVHTSTKLFWRFKATYEFHFFELLGTDILQLICQDHETDDPPHTMFLSLSALTPMVEADVRKQLDQKVKRLIGIRSRAPEGTDFSESDRLMYDDLTRKAAAEYVMAHFNVEKTADGTVSYKLTPLSAEGEEGALALTQLPAPEMRTDARIHRPRRNSQMEITALMKDLRAETTSLKQATSDATRLADLGNLAVGGFKAAMLGSKRLRSKTLDSANQTPARQRWQKAIHRVVLQNAVSKYTQLIAQSKCCNPTRVDTPTRLRGNRSTFPATDGFLPISKPGTPNSKLSPLADTGGFGPTSGFGATSSAATKRKQSRTIAKSESMPLPKMSPQQVSPTSASGALTPPKDIAKDSTADKLPKVRRPSGGKGEPEKTRRLSGKAKRNLIE